MDTERTLESFREYTDEQEPNCDQEASEALAFTDEFKQDAVELVVVGGYSFSHAADAIGAVGAMNLTQVMVRSS